MDASSTNFIMGSIEWRIYFNYQPIWTTQLSSFNSERAIRAPEIKNPAHWRGFNFSLG
jgi:hypothetical protein